MRRSIPAARQAVARGTPAWLRFDAALAALGRHFGWRARLAAPTLGRVLHAARRVEDWRLRRAMTLEPPTVRELNAAAQALLGAPAEDGIGLPATQSQPVYA